MDKVVLFPTFPVTVGALAVTLVRFAALAFLRGAAGDFLFLEYMESLEA